MAIDDWWEKSDKDLVALRRDLTPTEPGAPAVDHIIRLRIAEREARTRAALVRATAKLGAVTGRLGVATWVLALMTVLLVVAAAARAYPIFAGGHDAGTRIRRECEAIIREVAEYGRAVGRHLQKSTLDQAVLNCLLESAAKGRQ